jgi:hypothetical protein
MTRIIGRCPQCGQEENFSEKDVLYKKLTGILCYKLGCGHYAVIEMSNRAGEVELKAVKIDNGTLCLIETRKHLDLQVIENSLSDSTPKMWAQKINEAMNRTDWPLRVMISDSFTMGCYLHMTDQKRAGFIACENALHYMNIDEAIAEEILKALPGNEQALADMMSFSGKIHEQLFDN